MYPALSAGTRTEMVPVEGIATRRVDLRHILGNQVAAQACASEMASLFFCGSAYHNAQVHAHATRRACAAGSSAINGLCSRLMPEGLAVAGARPVRSWSRC